MAGGGGWGAICLGQSGEMHHAAPPSAFIVLVDQHRAWVKARVGVETAEVPRADSLCAHVVHRGEPVLPAAVCVGPSPASPPPHRTGQVGRAVSFLLVYLCGLVLCDSGHVSIQSMPACARSWMACIFGAVRESVPHPAAFSCATKLFPQCAL